MAMKDLVNLFLKQASGTQQTQRRGRPDPLRGPLPFNDALIPPTKLPRQEYERLKAVKDRHRLSWRELFIVMLNAFESTGIKRQKGD